MPAPRLLAVWLACFALLGPNVSQASRAFVPDDFPTVQGALDSSVDTVLVRAGIAAEAPVIRRGIVLRGDEGVGALPVLAGLGIEVGEGRIRTIRIERLQVDTPVGIHNEGPLELLSIVHCRLDSGLVHDWSEGLDTVMVHHSVVGSVFSVRAPRLFDFQHNTVHGTVAAGATIEGVALVRENTFTNECSNCFTGLRAGDYSSLEVSGNTFSGYGQGLHLSGDECRVTANRVEDCDVGYLLAVEVVHARDNQAVRCGLGFDVYADRCEIAGNRVLESAREGMQVLARYEGSVRENVVGRSGGVGFLVTVGGYGPAGGYAPGRITHNTSYLNTGSGFVIRGTYFLPIDSVVTHNLAYGNARYGLEGTAENSGSLICNDWFENALGAVTGAVMGPEDRMVDPLFCDLAADDVHLRVGSPLLDPDCGIVGALGSGCDSPTSVLVHFEGVALADAVELRWRLSAEHAVREAWVDRALPEPAPWVRIRTERRDEGSFRVDRDAEVQPGQGYRYRLSWMLESGEVQSSAPVVILSGGPVTPRLGPVTPNPSTGPRRITFWLRRECFVRLSVTDAQGREVARLHHGLAGAGAHEVVWTGAMNGAVAPSGIYFVTLRTPDGAQTRRALVVN